MVRFAILAQNGRAVQAPAVFARHPSFVLRDGVY